MVRPDLRVAGTRLFFAQPDNTPYAGTAPFPDDRVGEMAAMLQSVCVIIPARNEAAALPKVIQALPKVGRLIVVDNGSTDQTAAVARELGATVVGEPRPGYGRACLAGLAQLAAWAASGEFRAEVVAFLDGDYSDYPEFLPRLVEPILSDRADFVLGSRLRGRREPLAMLPQSVYGNRLACWLMRLLWKAPYTDLGPFRAIRYDALNRLGMQDGDFGWTIEMQIKAVLAGLRIMEIPVPYRRRIGTSKISGTVWGSARAAVKILYTLAKYAWYTRHVGRRHCPAQW
ncbi:MAG: glycosyl hydrolase [Pirellulaceae bacterium]|nr:MAG: glycosyl hydrolase [Pirellulaceae bacterium]